MAISNRDRVGRGFELLAQGLAPFVDRLMSAKIPDGGSWVVVIEAADAAKFGSPRTHSASDPRFLLRVLTEHWQVFSGAMSRTHSAIASELRQTGNDWAHNMPFNGDDTHRALDSMERLLTAAGAPDPAEGVRTLRMDHQRAVYEAETKKTVKAAGQTTVPGTGLRPWREVLPPHPDVQSGDYNAAEFAANLHRVALGEGAGEYVEPVAFFRRTYLTEGLRDLLQRAARRLTGDANASPVVNLQTNFGGGKTHSMLALYHLASGTPLSTYPQEVQEVLTGIDLDAAGPIRRVTLVGTHIAPEQPSIKDDGTEVRTLWGELAWQLGGRAAFDLLAEADRTGTNPGAALTELITAHTPCVILIDEWVAYARMLYGLEISKAGTFDTQFTFAQSLTEVVAATPGALLVISIPASDTASGEDAEADGASDIEVGGAHGREALRRLQNVVRRVADQWRPASARESFEIVRRRLFAEPDAEALGHIGAVARHFTQFYAEHRGEFPAGCAEPAYEERIRAAYPIHPELFDRLYEDWSTLERFQRTRGVLRLMSAVVHSLWQVGDAGPLITVGAVPLQVPTVMSELTQYLPDSWKPIIDADVDGESSTPARIDSERATFGGRLLTRRIARSVFIGSAPTLSSPHVGIDRQRMWLGVAIPGDTVGNFGSALEVLSQRATYLYVEDARYWFDTRASVTRTAQDYADRLRDRPEEVWAELRRRLGAESRTPGDFVRVHPAPEDSAGVPDTEEAKLVILHPRLTHSRGAEDSAAMSFARDCTDHRGSAQRTNRNTVVFLAADRARMDELMEAARDYLAWTDIVERVVQLDLTPQQAAQAAQRRTHADDAVTGRIPAAYIWAIAPDQPDPSRPGSLTVVKADGSQEGLAPRVSAKLRQNGLMATTFSARNIRMDLDGPLATAWAVGHISLEDLWGFYRTYPYLARLRDRAVLDQAVAGVLHELSWLTAGFALAERFDEVEGRYVGLAFYPSGTFGPITDGALLVAPDAALAQQDPEPQPGDDDDDGGGEGGTGGDRPRGPAPGPAPAPATRNPTRFFGVAAISPERYSRDFTRIAQEVIQHLAAADGTDLEITIEVRATNPDGFSADKVRVVNENARTLKFDQHGFEQQ